MQMGCEATVPARRFHDLLVGYEAASEPYSFFLTRSDLVIFRLSLVSTPKNRRIHSVRRFEQIAATEQPRTDAPSAARRAGRAGRHPKNTKFAQTPEHEK